MGEVELDKKEGKIIIRSRILFYGDAATAALSEQVAADIATHWNEPEATVLVGRAEYKIVFVITGIFQPDLQPSTVWYNTDPLLNFFRIEAFANTDISFVDAINSNTGYFKLDNLLNNSTTAAHEYGHSIGLDHPQLLDIRGMGQPGIMYPRGTICDGGYQYDPGASPGGPGGTINPFKRKVLQKDIENLKLSKLSWRHGKSIIGDFFERVP